jgi:transcriptional regulator with XRE-family HTH domain
MIKQNFIDLFVGQKLYKFRKQAKRSRIDVAAAIGVQPETLLEFETGTERVPADVLLQLSKVLQCDVREFFSGLVSKGAASNATAVGAVMASETTEEVEVATLLRNFSRVEDQKARSVILSLVAAYAENENAKDR